MKTKKKQALKVSQVSYTKVLAAKGRTWIVFHLDIPVKNRVRRAAKRSGQPITRFVEGLVKKAV